MKNHKVLILNWRCPKNPKFGGAEIVTLKHASYWVKQGMEVVWISGGFKNAQQEEIINGVNIVRYGNPYTVYLLAPFFYWLRWKGKFDVVIDEIHGLPFFTPLWAWKSKKITYIHEVAGEIWDEMFKPPLNWIGKLAEKIYPLFYRNIKFWTGSQSTKDELIKKYKIKENLITVIPHGVEIEKVQAKKQNNLILISVGRIVSMKRINKVIKLFAEVKQQVKDAQLWIVGRGAQAYITKLKKQAQKLGINESIKWWGFVKEEEKRKLLAKAHFLVNMSVKEGFGLVVLEANAQGTPAMGMKVAGLQDVIEDEVNGILIKNVGDGASKIIDIYKDKKHYQEMSARSLEYVKKYDWSKILDKSLNLVSSL